jgi:transporter family-2 protein
VNNLYLLVALITGAGIAVQALANYRLSTALGTPVWGAVGQFVVGLLLLLAIAIAMRQPAPDTDGLSRMPWWGWTGGVSGALFIVVSIVLTPRLGTALTLASITVGQLVAALVLDHYGWLGATVVRLSMPRLLGAACLLLGIVLMRWK